MEASNLTDREFKVMFIRMLQDLRKNLDITKDIETMKNNQLEINNAIPER